MGAEAEEVAEEVAEAPAAAEKAEVAGAKAEKAEAGVAAKAEVVGAAPGGFPARRRLREVRRA